MLPTTLQDPVGYFELFSLLIFTCLGGILLLRQVTFPCAHALGGIVSLGSSAELGRIAVHNSLFQGNKATSGSGGCILAGVGSLVGPIAFTVSFPSMPRNDGMKCIVLPSHISCSRIAHPHYASSCTL